MVDYYLLLDCHWVKISDVKYAVESCLGLKVRKVSPNKIKVDNLHFRYQLWRNIWDVQFSEQHLKAAQPRRAEEAESWFESWPGAMEDKGLSDEAVSAACKEGNPITKVTGRQAFILLNGQLYWFIFSWLRAECLSCVCAGEAVMQSNLLLWTCRYLWTSHTCTYVELQTPPLWTHVNITVVCQIYCPTGWNPLCAMHFKGLNQIPSKLSSVFSELPVSASLHCGWIGFDPCWELKLNLNDWTGTCISCYSVQVTRRLKHSPVRGKFTLRRLLSLLKHEFNRRIFHLLNKETSAWTVKDE